MARVVTRGPAGLLAIVTMAACATLEQQATPDPFDDAPVADSILVTVHNYDRRQATVYAYWNGRKERVGTVMTSKTETFRIAWRFEEMQLGYEFLGQRAVGGEPDRIDGFRSEVFYVTQGDHLDFIIQGTAGGG